MSTFNKAMRTASRGGKLLKHAVATQGKSLIDRLFPVYCPVCMEPASSGYVLCSYCLGELPALAKGCPICASLVPANHNGPCRQCRLHKPSFSHVFAPFYYAPPIDRLIRDVKYRAQVQYIGTLAKLLAHAAEAANVPHPDYFLAVPLHRKRFIVRGFNQSLEIALKLGRLLDVPVLRGCLRKTQAGPPQTALPLRKRLTSPQGTFAVRRLPPARHVTIIDDVMTSGSTANSVAHALRQHANVQVSVWVVAKTG